MTIKWGAEIPCNGRPDWLKDDDVCAVRSGGEWCGTGERYQTAEYWAFHSGVDAFKLPADHPYYKRGGGWGMTVESPISQAIATLEAAGYKVTKPDMHKALWTWLGEANTQAAGIAMLRRAIPDPASIDVAALAK